MLVRSGKIKRDNTGLRGGYSSSSPPNSDNLDAQFFGKMLSLRLLLVAMLAAYTNALLVGTRPALAPKVQLRAQEAPPPPPKGKLGATVDQDGKSNVWVR